jgi:UDP-glucose 4-epimerase
LNDVVSWVVGRRGLLGRAVETAIAARGPVWHPDERFEWQSPHPALLADQIRASCLAFADAVVGTSWQVAWCAGAGVVGSEMAELGRETEALQELLRSLGHAFGRRRLTAGRFFLASSAGGLYAGSPEPPFSEESPVQPLSPYGETKLRQETLTRDWCRDAGVPALIGRISNLYGPGQNLSKNQGLITTVCSRVLARQPLMLYVPLDTIRDYCYTTDAGRLVADGLAYLRDAPADCRWEAPVVVKIIASQQPTTIATVLSQVRLVTKRPVSVVIASSATARRQAPDLRMISTVWPELDRRPLTTMSAGLRTIVNELLARAGRGQPE